MEQTQIKTILVNILTGGIIIGVIIGSYYVLVKKNTAELGQVNTVAQVANETASIGAEIDEISKDLKDLGRAVESSTIIFELPEFKNLKDFTAAVPKEPVERDNPFLPTVWKLKIKAIIDSTPKVVVPEQPKVADVPQNTVDVDGV